MCRVDIALGMVFALIVATGGARAETATPSGPGGGGLEQERLLSSLSFSAGRGPVSISARSLEFDYKARELTFRGAVVVTQDDVTLHSNVLRVVLDEGATARVREVVAEGSVRVSQGERTATGGRATFDQATRTVVLSGGAVLRDGGNELTGEKLVLFLDEQRSVVEGGRDPVHMVLVPATPVPASPAAGVD